MKMICAWLLSEGLNFQQKSADCFLKNSVGNSMAWVQLDPENKISS